jgi:cytochrome c peroxidase
MACTFDDSPPVMVETPYQFDLPAGVPLPTIPDGKEITMERVALGKKLFYDKRLSSDSTISCGSCHLQSAAFADHNPVSIGVESRVGFRNSPTLVNVGYHPYFFKEGGNPTLESQAFGPIEEHHEMDFNAKGIVERMENDEDIQFMSFKAFGRSFDNFVLVRSLGAFQRTLVSANSRFDQFHYLGDVNALNESERRGMALFFSEDLNCTQCHGGFDFTEYAIENNGTKAEYQDLGLMRLTFDSLDIGKFKVPTLRNVELTYPYMHDGSFPTLESVIEHYNQGGQNHPIQNSFIQPLHLNDQEKADLVAFLKSLTDWEFINNPAFSDNE